MVVSINPPDGSYQVATLDRALLDRMVMIYVETDYNCWARYAKEQEFDETVQQFLSAYPNLLAKPGAPLDMQMEPTERAWEMVSTLRIGLRQIFRQATKISIGKRLSTDECWILLIPN